MLGLTKSSMKQLPLQFSSSANFDIENYIVTDSNQEAFNWVNKWPNWEQAVYSNVSCIFGEKGSGKTYLAKIWQNHSNAEPVTLELLERQSYFESGSTSYLLENLETFIEQRRALFSFLNHIIQSKKFLLITSEIPPMQIDFGLPDLQSRLNSVFSIPIKKPSEQLVAQILVKYFSDRQIIVESNVINYLMHRIDRSYAAIAKVVNSLDQHALTHHRKISIAMIKEVCDPEI